MGTYKCLFIFTLFAHLTIVFCNRERKMDTIIEALRRIEENLAKEDRLWKITNITRIDFTMGNLNSKVDRLFMMLSGSPSSITGRSETSSDPMSNELESNMGQIQTKLQSLETSVGNVEKSIKSTNFDATKIIEMERRMTQLKDDMNTKMRKMMSVLTSLYELNKDMKTNSDIRSESEDHVKSKDVTSEHTSEFLMENLDEMERKIKEQLSVLSSELRSEITSLKIVASSVSSSCQTSSTDEDDDDSWMTPQNNMARRNQGGRSIGNTLDNLMESLGRSTREIREEIQSGIQGIDIKLENLTVLTQTQPRCDALETSDSVISSRKVDAPQGLFPSIQDPLPPRQVTDNVRKGKSEKCSKIPHNVPNPKSCADLRKGGATCDGIYVIFPKGVRAVRTLCDMTTDGGGWTVLMRRGDYGDKMTTFNKNWLSYKNGFGDSEGEFWLGNDVIHYLTTEEPNMLRIHLGSFDGDQIDLDYSSFSISDETNNFRSSLGPAIGSPSIASNGFKYHGNRPFSTFDRKNDRAAINCAAQYKGGWWFNGCYQGFLTGEYFQAEERRDDSQGILWFDWKRNEALKEAAMLIRPVDFKL